MCHPDKKLLPNRRTERSTFNNQTRNFFRLMRQSSTLWRCEILIKKLNRMSENRESRRDTVSIHPFACFSLWLRTMGLFWSNTMRERAWFVYFLFNLLVYYFFSSMDCWVRLSVLFFRKWHPVESECIGYRLVDKTSTCLLFTEPRTKRLRMRGEEDSYIFSIFVLWSIFRLKDYGSASVGFNLQGRDVLLKIIMCHENQCIDWEICRSSVHRCTNLSAHFISAKGLYRSDSMREEAYYVFLFTLLEIIYYFLFFKDAVGQNLSRGGKIQRMRLLAKKRPRYYQTNKRLISL